MMPLRLALAQLTIMACCESNQSTDWQKLCCHETQDHVRSVSRQVLAVTVNAHDVNSHACETAQSAVPMP